jgi:hypothetical protein
MGGQVTVTTLPQFWAIINRGSGALWESVGHCVSASLKLQVGSTDSLESESTWPSLLSYLELVDNWVWHAFRIEMCRYDFSSWKHLAIPFQINGR